jgi:hypothetical protein
MASSILSQQREILRITRSEATDLVFNYRLSVAHAEKNNMEPLRVFRDNFENLKPCYVGNATSSMIDHPDVDKFYRYSNGLFYLIQKLCARSTIKLDADAIADISKILHMAAPQARLQTTTFLDWAVHNWYFRNEQSFTEDLGDNCIENQSCGICEFSGHGTFYYSTSYGLELPVCQNCLSFDNLIKDKESSSAYETEDEEEVSASEADASEADASEAEYDESDEDDVDYEEEESEDESASGSEEESASEAGSSEAGSSEAGSSGSEEEADNGKVYGCDGCDFEWRDGWKHGWRAAMKEIARDAADQRRYPPPPPECEWCGRLYGLRKCGGDCNGSVSYCSSECQSKDWRKSHKSECSKY